MQSSGVSTDTMRLSGSPDYSPLIWILPLFEDAMFRHATIQLSATRQLPEFAKILHGIIGDFKALHRDDPSTAISQRVLHDMDLALELGRDIALTRDEVPAIVDLLSLCIDTIFAPRMPPDSRHVQKLNRFTPNSATQARVSACWNFLRRTEIELDLPDNYEGQCKAFNERSFRIIKAIRQSPGRTSSHQEGFQKFEEKIRSLKLELAKRDNQCQEYQKQIGESTQSDNERADIISKLGQEKHVLECTLERKDSDFQQLKEELRAVKDTLSQRVTASLLLKKELDETKSALGQKVANSQRLEEKLGALKDTLGQKQILYESLEKELDTTKPLVNERDLHCQALEKEVSSMKQLLGQKDKGQRTFNQTHTRLQDSFKKSQATCQLLEKDLIALQDTLAQKEVICQRLENEVGDPTVLKKSLAQKIIQCGALAKELSEVEETLCLREQSSQTSDQQLRAMTENAKQQHETYVALDAILTDTKDSLQRSEKFCKRLEKKLCNLPMIFDGHAKDLAETTRGLINKNWLPNAHPITVALMRIHHIGRQLQVLVEAATKRGKEKVPRDVELQPSTETSTNDNPYPKVQAQHSQDEFHTAIPISSHERAVLRLESAAVVRNSEQAHASVGETVVEQQQAALAVAKIAATAADEEARATMQDLKHLRKTIDSTKKDLEVLGAGVE